VDRGEGTCMCDVGLVLNAARDTDLCLPIFIEVPGRSML
jgi:hypothetical protein